MGSKESGSNTSKDKKRIIRIVLALVLSVVAFLGGDFLGAKISDLIGDGSGLISWSSYLGFTFRSVIAVTAFILLGGKKWVKFDKDSYNKTWKFVLPLVLINVAFSLLLVSFSFIARHFGFIESEPSSDFIVRALMSLVLMILVGINEEVIFRGLQLGGLLLWFGKKKNGVLIAAIISSLIFGYIHVMMDIDFTNMSALMTGLMKTIETSMFGFVWCYCVLEYKNYPGVIITHAVFDWLLIASMLLFDSDVELSYVSSDSKTAIMQCIVFGVLILLYIPRTVKAFKGIRAMEPTYGPFDE